MNINKLILIFFNPRNAGVILISLIFLLYTLPSILLSFNYDNKYYIQFLIISFIGMIGLFIGRYSKLLDGIFKKDKKYVSPSKFVKFFIILFFINIILVISIQPEIPLINALLGNSSQDELDAQRGYLKNAGGLGFIVNYLNVFLLSSFMPLCIGLSFLYNLKIKKFILVQYLLFSVLFLQKSLFLFAILPLFIALRLKNRLKFGKIFVFFIFIYTLLSILTSLSVDVVSTSSSASIAGTNFFSAKYEAVSSADFIIWRAIGVPFATAIDSLIVFDNYLRNQNLFGGTSRFLAAIFNLRYINVEQLVFNYQFGSIGYESSYIDDSIGRANAIYLIDAFINFNWIGVLVISLIIGYIFRGFWKLNERAWSVLFLLFTFQLLSVSFINLILSGGYLIIFLLMLTLKFNK